MRTVLLSLGMAAAVAAPAQAAPGCHLLRDAWGDAYVVNEATRLPAPALDIRSVDVATGRKTLVVVLRMASTEASADPATAPGMTWEVSVTIGGVDHRFNQRMTAGLTSGFAKAGDDMLDGVTVRTGRGAVTWTVPRANVRALAKPGATLSRLFASTFSLAGHDHAPDGARPSSVRYRDRAPSCVRAA
jgi:hypothetical protein